MELTKNQKIVGISLAGVIAWLLYRKKIVLQSHRTETPAGPSQVVVPVATGAGTGPIANVLGNVLPSTSIALVNQALGQTPLVVQNGRQAPTRVTTVADVQHALNFLKVCGNTVIRDSGVLDVPTVACIKAFQTLMNLPVTGMDDPATKLALEAAIAKAATSVSAPAILNHPSVVSPPVVNPTIATERDLQRNLNILGASPKLAEDGKIGPYTTAAIKAFQVSHGMPADGLPGPQTKAAIAAAVAGVGSGAAPQAGISAVVQAGLAAAAAGTQQPLASGDFGWQAPPPPPPGYQHPQMPGFMGAGGGPDYRHHDPHRPWADANYVPPPPPPGFIAPPPPQGFIAPPPPPGGFIAPPMPQGGAVNSYGLTPSPPGTPHGPGWVSADGTPWMKSWERWQVVHAGRSDNTFTHYTQWRDGVGKQPGAVINGDGNFGFARGGGFRGAPFRPGVVRGRAFALGMPYDEDVVVETVDEDGNPVTFNGEEVHHIENEAVQAAHRAAAFFAAHGDHRFQYHEGERQGWIDPHRHGRFGFEHHDVARRGWFDRFRGWWGGRRDEIAPPTVNDNPYIPPPATPPVMNWDPFAVQTAPAVDRWNPEELRRREELERGGFREEVRPGRDHVSPPGPPMQRR